MRKIAVLALAAFLCGCQIVNKAAALPTASQDGQGAFFTVQGSPVAIFSPTAQNKPKSTPVPTTDNAAIIAQLATSQAITAQLQSDLVKANNRKDEINLDTKKAEAENSKWIAANSANLDKKILADAALLAEKNRAKELLNAAAQIENDAAAIELQLSQERTKQVALLILAAVLVAGTWLLFRVVTRPHVSQAVEQEPPQRYPGTYNAAPAIPAYTPLVPRVVPAGVSESHLIEFAQTVLTSRNKDGIPFSRKNWLALMGRPEWDALVNDYLIPEGYAMSLNPGAANSSFTFTPEGERYLRGFEDLPLPHEQDSSISA